MYNTFVGDVSDELEQESRADVNKPAHHAYHQLTARNHDWLLRTDADHLMQLLGQGRVRDRPANWLPPPPPPTRLTEPSSSASVDWRDRRRQLVCPKRSANDDVEADRRTTHVDSRSTSNYCQSAVELSSVADCQSATTKSSAGLEETQPFPVYAPLLGRMFPTTSSTSSSSLLSSSLAYEMLATAALSSLRHALPFASLLPPSSTSYDVISAAAAAAAMLQPRSHHVGPFVTPSALGQPEVDHADGVSGGSVLDLVVAPSQSATTTGVDRGAADRPLKRSACDGDQLPAPGARPRGCVWRPY